MNIQPGKNVTIEIKAQPASAAGRKTLMRLCRKDAAVVKHHRHQKRKRPSQEWWRRGGKMWHHQMKSVSIVKLAPGSRYTVRASVDVLRDLAGLADCVAVTPA